MDLDEPFFLVQRLTFNQSAIVSSLPSDIFGCEMLLSSGAAWGGRKRDADV